MFSISRKKNSNIGTELIFIIAGIVYSTPLLSSKAIIMLLPVGLYMIYILSHWGTIDKKKNHTLVAVLIVFLLIVFAYRLIGVSDAGWSRYTLKLGFFLPIFIMLTIPFSLSEKSIKRIWWLTILVSTANILYNIYLGILYPSINTQEVQALMDNDVLDSLNLGRSPFFTYSLFFFSACFFVFLNCKLKVEKIFVLICSLIAAVYIFWFCFKASVVVFTLVTAVVLFYAKRTKQKTRFLLSVGLISVVVALVMTLFSNEIIQVLISISPDERLTGRLVTLIDSNSSEAYDATLQGREDLVLLSLETWLSGPMNFLFGIGDHYIADGSSRATGIGQHAEIIDGLAQYGVIGMFFFFVIIKKSLEYVVSVFSKESSLQIIVIFGVFVLCGFAKYIFLPGIGFVLFILLPLSAHYLNKSSK